MKNLEFETQAIDDLAWWIRQNPKVALRIIDLVRDIERDPFRGKGKPELLKHDLSGYWSRRIDKQHRLVYKVLEDKILISACRGHY